MDGLRLSNASNIFYGNNQVNNIHFKNNLAWTSENKQWGLMPIVMDSAANIQLSWNTATPNNTNILMTGNTSFIMKPVNGEKLSDIEIKYPYDKFTSTYPKTVINKIDDYALYIHKFYGYNTWRGGYASANWNETTTLKYFNNEKTIKFYGVVDENNKTYMNGLYVNKVIKSPSVGSTGIVKVKFFPYKFDDEFFVMNTFDLYLLNYNDTSNNRKNLYLWDNDNKVFRHKTNGSIYLLEWTIFESLNITYEGLEGTIEYKIRYNYTNEFLDAVLCTNDSMVHFIQEPYNTHRIYIAEFSDRYFTNKYLDSQSNNYEYLFHLSGSKIIDKSLELIAPYKLNIMIPYELYDEYNIEWYGNYDGTGYFMWGAIGYEHYILNKNSKIIFKKK